MNGFTPSAAQACAIAEIRDWYLNRRHIQQIFRLFGYAGSGKSTITRYAIEALGLAMKGNGGWGGVQFAAFTGKAALVMTRKGTPASTIHSLIYRVSEATEEEIERVEKELAQLKAGLFLMGPGELAFARSQIARLELRLAHIHEPRFVLNSQSLVRDCDLIVLDEVSMVGEEMANDLLAFGKPILVLGDPGQLPPIHGEGAFTNVAPDVMLDEIHRQAEGSAILRLATMARQGLPIDYGAYDEHVWKMPRRDVSPEQMLKGGQVLCGSNATRRGLNMSMKRAAGFMHDLPTGSGEKIICLKNRHDLGLINGMFLSLSDVHHDARNEHSFSASVQTEDGQEISGRQHFWRGEYDDHIVFDRDRGRRDAQVRRTLVETSWGYAITVHKSQGSSWDNVILFDDGFGRTAIDRNRWLYTAITRAEKGLVILS
jgi:exodeoxyribonuclease-5